MFVKNKIKSILSLAISLAIIMLSLAVPINTQFSASAATYPTPPEGITVWNGTTTEVTLGADNKTYNVSTAEELAWALKSILKIKKINLTADIYLNDLTNFDSWNSTTEGLHNWTSAELPDPDTFCRVEIQGNNHTIYGLYDVNTTGNAGLIHNFTTDWPNYFKCYNLGIDYAYISGKNSGAFVALYTLQGDQRANDIVFENCFVGENVIIDCPADSNGAGGFVGAGSGLWSYQECKSISYKNCYSLVNIKNSGNVKEGKYGAFVGKGYLKNISMEYCYTNNDKMFGYTTPYWDGPDKNYGIVDPTINYSPVALKNGSSYYTTACADENMKGITAAISMANLGAAYVTTDGYPILAVFNNDPNAVPLGTLGTTYFAGGKGTEAEPLLISTEEHLKNALDLFGANLHYKLTNDIYVNYLDSFNRTTGKATDADNPPEGWFAAQSHDGYTNSKGDVGAFSGTLDGDGYAVKGISYPLIGQWTNEKYTFATGLIPVIDNATVKNITISNSYFTASSLLDSSYNLKTQAYISPVCGIVKASAEFSNVTVDETVIVEYSAKGAFDCWAVMGGIVAKSQTNKNSNQLTKVTNCGVSCRVKGNNEKENNKGVRLTGLVGEFGWWCNLDISNSYSKGLPTLDYTGGNDGNFKLSNLFSDTNYTSPVSELKFETKQILLDSLDFSSLTNNGFDSTNWEADDEGYPILKCRVAALASRKMVTLTFMDGDKVIKTVSAYTIDETTGRPAKLPEVTVDKRAGYVLKGWTPEYTAGAALPTVDTVYTAVWEIMGDINEDNSVNILDLVRLKKYEADPTVSVDTENALFVDFEGYAAQFAALRKYLLSGSWHTPGLFADEGYTFVWGDEFNADTLNSDKWQDRDKDAGKSYSDRISSNAENLTLDNNALNLRVHSVEEDGNIIYHTTTGLKTLSTMNFKYGYLEMKIKAPVQGGLWPAFWLSGLNGPWNEDVDKKALTRDPFNTYGTEVDILEQYRTTDKFYTFLHKWYPGSNPSSKPSNSPTYTFDGEYHIYGFKWTPEEMSVYVDGNLCYTADLTESFDDTVMDGFRSPHYLIIGDGINTKENGWEDSPLTGEVDCTLSVDWIRLYQIPEQGGLWTK